MKKISLITILFIIGLIISCNNSTESSSIVTGYTDPGLGTAKTQALKSYTIAAESCIASKSCGAIIFKGTLNYVDYVGFGVDNYLSGAAKFALKISWEASSISSINTTSFTVSINDGTNIYTTPVVPDDNLNITIVAGTDGSADNIPIRNITFVEDLTVTDGSGNDFTINSGNTIQAYEHPE